VYGKLGLERNLETLTSLGLTRTEAEIYIFLTQNGEQEKQAIAIEFNITTRELSQNLSEMKEKGFIDTKIRKKNTYFALPLEKVLEQIIDSKLGEAQLAIEETEKFLKPMEDSDENGQRKSRLCFQSERLRELNK
jgi:sugar-specific transcriptional regulator TrmB